MDLQQAQDDASAYRGRRVSDLALMFESKIKEKVRSSPYLRQYGKLNGPKYRTERYSPPIVKSMSESKKTEALLVEYPRHDVGPDSEFLSSSHDMDDFDFFKKKITAKKIRPKSETDSELNKPILSPVIKHQYDIKKDSPKSFGSFRKMNKGKMKDSKEIETKFDISQVNPQKNELKHRRSKSFTNGIQRFLKRERRRGSLDGKETERNQDTDVAAIYYDGAASAASDSHLQVDKEKQKVILSDNSNPLVVQRRRSDNDLPENLESPKKGQKTKGLVTPRLSFMRRRRSDNEDLPENQDASRKGQKTKSRRTKGFFRAISLNNIGEAKRNAIFTNDNWCPNCQDSLPSKKKVLSLESFNNLRDERDLLRNERDRAVEEWSEAASRWEQMLDDMDTLMAELIKVKDERDEKTTEISELINEYEDELKIRETDYSRLQVDFCELEDNLSVAKKERIDALTEYEELLKRNYDLSKDIERFEDLSMELRSCVAVNEEDIISLKQQIENLQDERDHALELWNSSVEERKKLHKEMASLIQARDESLRKTFQQAEEINKMREDRDALQRAIDSKRANGHLDKTETVRGAQNSQSKFDNNGGPSLSNHVVTFDENYKSYEDAEKTVPEFVELAVSLERIDSKYGIRIDTAVDEPKIMVAHVGAHAASTSNIRKYDRIASVNGASVARADKKTVEKLIRDCPGRLTMVLRRETSADKLGRLKDVEITLPKNSKHRGYRDLGMKFKVEISSIDEQSPLGGREKLDDGDIITKMNTQDINKVLEAVLYKVAKKHSGKISMRLLKKDYVSPKGNYEGKPKNSEEIKDTNSASPNHSRAHQTVLNISHASNQSLSSMTSEQTYTSTYTDDNESLFSGSLTPSIIVCPCDGNEEDVSSLSGRARKLSNPVLEQKSIPVNEEGIVSTNEQVKVGESMVTRQFVPNGHQNLNKRNTDIRSLRSLKIASSARVSKQPLRRVRSDAVDRKAAQKAEAQSPPGSVLLAVDETRGSPIRTRNSWLIPSPAHTPIENRRSNDTVNVFATLPRQKRKSVNEADCNKRTTHRVLRLEKAESQPLGFDICGGNKVGIFVKEIKDGSMAAVGGMKVGDRILYINSFDLHCASLDFATRIILKSERLTNFRIEVKFEERFKDILKEVPRDSLYVRTLRACDNNKDGSLQFGVGEILHVTNTLALYNRQNRAAWQWFAEKVSRHSAGQQGYVPRLESFGEAEDAIIRQPHSEVEGSPDKSSATDHKRKRRRSASDVKKWLLRKPSLSRRKKERDVKAAIADIGDNAPYYEILWDN